MSKKLITDAMVRAYKATYLKHCDDALNGRIPRAEDFTFEASRKGIAAALAAMEQQGAPVDSRDEALSPSGNREMAKSLYEAFQYKTKHGSRADDAFIAIVSSALAAKEQQP